MKPRSGPFIRWALAMPLLAVLIAGCNSNSAEDEPVASQQGITKIVLDTVNSETVTFGGTTFGAVGTYQKIRGVAFGQLNPNDPKNAVIADIALAEKNATTGMVEYSTDFT